MEFNIKNLAYCGLYCPQCSFKVTYETKNKSHLLNMPERYNKLKELDLSECKCDGCKFDNICGDCDIKDCAVLKNISDCSKCKEFPCEKILNFENDGVPHHKEGVENLHAIKKFGYEKWFETIKENLYCNCGERLSWYYNCPNHE